MTWRRSFLILMWGLSIVLSLGLIVSGFDRVRLTPGVVAQFEAFGYSMAFARLIGVLEILGGLALLVPRIAVPGACTLTVLMLGAIGTHVQSGFGSPFHAGRALVFLIVIIAVRLWAARDDRSGASLAKTTTTDYLS